ARRRAWHRDARGRAIATRRGGGRARAPVRPVRWSPLVVIALASIAEAQSLATLRGKVIDRATKAPVAGAVITIGGELAASDDDGAFTLALPPGRYTLEVSAPFLVTQRTAL